MPRTRAGCANTPRPCPFVSCAHHLYLDVSPINGNITLNFPDIEPGAMSPTDSCALDIADQGGASLDEVGTLLNITRERVRQVETRAMAKIERQHANKLRGLAEDFGLVGPARRRRLPVLQQAEALLRERSA